MGKIRPNEYAPDEVSAPGETLLEAIEALGMTQAKLAERTGRTRKMINQVVKGIAPITPETAIQLERALGVPARFWNNRENRYREYLARVAEAEKLGRQLQWLKKVPVAAMVKHGWIRRVQDKVGQLDEVLSFFGVASTEAWESVWTAPQAAFRASPTFEKDPFAVAAWLRRGELRAQQVDCAPYSASAFRAALREARSLTVEPAAQFGPALRSLCADCGVVVVYVPQLPGTRACGAARWLSGRAVIQLSLRYKRDDQLWFSFFHEAGHIRCHGRRQVFVDERDAGGTLEEEEANRFAEDALIPRPSYEAFVAAGEFTKQSIRRFAAEVGIAAGIVVGRLQHDGHVGYRSRLNSLKRRLEWQN